MQNAAKYSGATSVVVALSERDGQVLFEVTDDGSGFDPARTPRGAGLTNMADRLAAQGGDLEVTSAPGHGTTVAGRVPAGLREEA
jgi:signal transduction histidine kinase